MDEIKVSDEVSEAVTDTQRRIEAIIKKTMREEFARRDNFMRSVFNAIWHGFAEFKKAVMKQYDDSK